MVHVCRWRVSSSDVILFHQINLTEVNSLFTKGDEAANPPSPEQGLGPWTLRLTVWYWAMQATRKSGLSHTWPSYYETEMLPAAPNNCSGSKLPHEKHDPHVNKKNDSQISFHRNCWKWVRNAKEAKSGRRGREKERRRRMIREEDLHLFFFLLSSLLLQLCYNNNHISPAEAERTRLKFLFFGRRRSLSHPMYPQLLFLSLFIKPRPPC